MPIPVAVGAALVKGGADLLNSFIGSSSGANLNKKNRQWQAEQNTLQYERQRQLTQDSPLLQKIGLQNAGISTAAMNGYSGGTATVSASNTPSSVPEYTPMDLSNIVDAFLQGKSLENDIKTSDKQRELLDKQSKLLDQNIEKQKMDNEVQRNEIEAFRNASSRVYFVDDDGKQHFTSDSDFGSFVESYLKTHDNTFPDMVKTPTYLSDRAASASAAISNFDQQIETNKFYRVHYELMKAVESEKLNDPRIVSAMADMDRAQYLQIGATINKLYSDISVNEYQKKYLSASSAAQRANIAYTFAQIPQVQQSIMHLKNSSVGDIIDQLADSHSVKDFLVAGSKLLLTTAGGIIGGFMPKTKVFNSNTRYQPQNIDSYNVNINGQ